MATKFFVFFWDKKEKKDISFSGNIQHKKIENNLYFKTNDFVFDI
jgi:hypothetical protein